MASAELPLRSYRMPGAVGGDGAVAAAALARDVFNPDHVVLLGPA